MTQIVGVVSDRLWLLVPLVVSGGSDKMWAVVDTGFEGYLMVPESERGRLRIARTSLMAPGTNADGSSSLMPLGRTSLQWLSAPIMIETHVPSSTMVDGMFHDGDPIVGIIGLYLLQGLRLTAELYPGRNVALERAA